MELKEWIETKFSACTQDQTDRMNKIAEAGKGFAWTMCDCMVDENDKTAVVHALFDVINSAMTRIRNE